jgi:hypothetical protein
MLLHKLVIHQQYSLNFLIDSKENADAAQKAAKDFVSTNEVFKDGAIIPYYSTEDVVAYYDSGDDCINTSNTNKYLSNKII